MLTADFVLDQLLQMTVGYAAPVEGAYIEIWEQAGTPNWHAAPTRIAVETQPQFQDAFAGFQGSHPIIDWDVVPRQPGMVGGRVLRRFFIRPD